MVFGMRSMDLVDRSDEEKDPQAVWSFFDAYKTPGIGSAVSRPDFETFSHVTEDTKQKDRLLLQQKMNRPTLREQKTQGSDAFAFENFLTTHAMNYRWFGGELSPTSVYDDWVSGADAVVEWPCDPPIRLAIDFTSTVQDKTFWRKSDKLEGNVLVKYFRSHVERENGQPKEMRVSLPVVLLGFDDSVFRKIAEEQEPMSPDHPFRRYLLEQALIQIQTQLELFLKKEKEGGMTSGKNQNRKGDLERVLFQLTKEFEQASAKEIDKKWQAIVQQSKTHRVLSGT